MKKHFFIQHKNLCYSNEHQMNNTNFHELKKSQKELKNLNFNI